MTTSRIQRVSERVETAHKNLLAHNIQPGQVIGSAIIQDLIDLKDARRVARDHAAKDPAFRAVASHADEVFETFKTLILPKAKD